MWGVVHGACLIWPCRTPTLFQIKVANQRADPVSRAFSLRQLGDCECLARKFTMSPKTRLLSAAPCLPTRVELHWSVGPVAVNLQRRSNPVPGCVCRSHLHSAEAGHVPWRTDSGRELGMVDRGRAPVAKPFHMHTLLRGAWCLMAWTPATRVHELSLRWCSGSCRASWYFFPPTTFKQSFFSLTHSLASLHSFRVPALPQVHPIHSPSLTSLRFFLHLHFACWHVLALTRNSSYLQTLTQDFVAPSLPAR
jgi:hypothetical protein